MVGRQLAILRGIASSARFLKSVTPPPTTARSDECAPDRPIRFVVILPVLREAGIVEDAVKHFLAVASRPDASLVVVTSERERAGAATNVAEDTIDVVRRLARLHRFTHLHYGDASGLKGDQINYVAENYAKELTRYRLFFVCYDVDSRPSVDVLGTFAAFIAAMPNALIFHQSSRFELRLQETTKRDGCATATRQASMNRMGIVRRIERFIVEGSALHANRFVLGFELPRLAGRLRSATSIGLRLRLCVYAHVTGHGVCIDATLLRALPLPAKSPLEDMHYSFWLAARGIVAVPVPTLDVATVPGTVRGRIEQAARWFFGPARALRYLRDASVPQTFRSHVLAASALGSAAEWLGCAFVPTLIISLLLFGGGSVRGLALAIAIVVAAQCTMVEMVLGRRSAAITTRILRIVFFPVGCTIHGLGGILGLISLWAGGDGIGRTERSAS